MALDAETARLKRVMYTSFANDYVAYLLRAIERVADRELDGAIECLIGMHCTPSFGGFGLFRGNGHTTVFAGFPPQSPPDSAFHGTGLGAEPTAFGWDAQTRVEELFGRPGSGVRDEMCGHHPASAGVIDLTVDED